MIKTENKKQYDLEDRTQNFARCVRVFVRKLPRSALYVDDIKQLIRSSGSVGANYIEANESLSKKDFLMRVKISRKEAKESIYWLNLIDVEEEKAEEERIKLIQEGKELMMILSAIMRKSDPSL